MAKTHLQVARDFHSCKLSKGSRMHTDPTNFSRILRQPASTFSGPLFDPLCSGYSYQTKVAWLMRNLDTGMRELWVTPLRHSQSTQKHIGYYVSEFRAWYRKNYPDMDSGSEQIYYTPAVDRGTTRVDSTIAQQRYASARALLGDVDLPRVREATRRGVLSGVLYRVDETVRHITRDVPDDCKDADDLKVYAELMDLREFVTGLAALPDTDEVRAAVRGYFALDRA